MIKNYQKGSYKISILAVLAVIIIGAFTLTTFDSAQLDARESINKNIEGQLVLIDPGHGGKDPGAVYTNNSKTQLKEKDLNLDIALKLKSLLEKSGIKVAMSRVDDSYVLPETKVKWASQQDAALLISIHNNSSSNSAVSGTTTYSKPVQNDDAFKNSQIAAPIIQTELVKKLGTKNLGNKAIKLKIFEAPVPAVMTDIAFISNESDREKLQSEEFRIKAAQALHDGIIEALNEMQTAENKK